MTPFSFVHWVVCPSLYGLWWAHSLLSIGLSVLLFVASDDLFLSFVHWVFCPSSLYGLWWALSLLSIGLSVLLLLWPLITPFSFVHSVVCPFSLYGLWWALSLLSIGLSVLLFIASDEPSVFCPLGCLSFFSLWPLMTPFSFVHWVVCPSLYGLWWPLSLLSIGLSVLLQFMASDEPFLFCPMGCRSFFSLWHLMSPFSFIHWVVCPLYGLWWTLFLLSIGLSVFLFMTSDDPFLFCPLGCLSFSLWPRMSPLSLVHWVVCPSSPYDLWWPLSLLSIGLSVLLLFMTSDDTFLFYPLGYLSFSSLWLLINFSVLLFMTSDDPSLFCPLGCLSFFTLWPLMTPLSFVRWVFCPSSLCDLWWPLSLWSIGLSVLLFMTSDEPSLFGPLGCLSFFSLWPLMTPFSFVHWVVCPSLYGLWWAHSLLSIGLSVLLLFMTSDDPFLFCPLGLLSFFSLWPLMTPFSLVHWVVCPSVYDLWWPLSLWSIGLSLLLLFMASDDPFLFCPLGCLSFSLWPLMTLSLLSIGFSVLLQFMASDDTSLFCPLGCLSFSLWPLMTLSLLSIGLSVLLLFMTSDDPSPFCPLGCLSFSVWPLMNPFSLVHWVVSPSLYGLWWPFLFCPLGCLSFFSLWPLMTPLSFVHWAVCPSLYGLWWPLSLFVHWVVCPSLYGLWWPLSLLSIGLSVLIFMASDEPFLFCPLGCLFFFSLWTLMAPFSFIHWVVCPSSLYDLWWPLSLLSIVLSVLLLFMASDDHFLFCPLGCLPFFSLWPLMTLLSFVHWVVCPSSLYDIWWPLSLLSIVLSVLFMASDNPSLFGPLGCLPFFSLWPLMTLHSLLSIGFSVLLFMASDEPFLFYPLGCLSFFSLWPLMTPFSLVHWVVCPSLYDLWWPLSLWSIGLSLLLLFMASDDPFYFCPSGCLFLSLWPLMSPFSFVHWVVCPSSLYDLWWPLSLFVHWVVCHSSLYGLWWPLSLLSIGLSVHIFMTSDEPFLFCPLGCLFFFSLWTLMTPFSFIHWVVCPSSLYDLWWPLSLLSIVLSVLLLFMASDDHFLFSPLGCLSFSLWPLMTPFSLLHWVVCPSLYGFWWPLSLLSIGLSVLLLFMASDDPSLFCPLGCLSFSLWPLMTLFSFVHWVVCPSSRYGLWWPLSLLSIGLSVLLLFMTSDDPFLFCPLCCLSFSLWPLITPLSLVHWVVCPSSLYGLWWPFTLFCPLGFLSFSLWPLMNPFSFIHWDVCPSLYDFWWPLSLWSIGLSLLLLFMASDDPFFFCPLGCMFLSLWPLMSPFSFVHWVVCPSSLYDLWWPLSLLSIGLSVLLCMASDEPFLFGPLGCLSFSLWPLMTLSLLSIGLSVLLLFMNSDDPFLFYPLGCLSFFSIWSLMTPFSFVHCVICPSSLYGLWWPLSLFSIGLSVLLFMASDDPFLVVTLGCLSFSLWLLMTPFSFVHWVVCSSSLYGLWWSLSILSIGLSVLLFMASDDPFLFCPLGCLPFFSLWPLMTPLSFVHWVVCPSSLYDIWWPLSLLSIVLSVLLFMASDNPSLFGPLGCLPFFSLWPLMTLHSLLSIGFSVLLFMASDEPFLFYPLGCLSFFSLWPLMTPFSLVHWVVCPSLYDLWWPLSLWSIGLSLLLLFMASDDPFFFCPLGCLFLSLWPLMSPFSFVHWVVCPSSLYDLWWPLSLLSIGLSVLLCMASDEPFLFGPLGCLSFSLWPLMTLSLLSIGLSVLLLFMASDDTSLFCPLGCLSFSLWPLMTPFSFCPLGCLSFFSLWPLMTPLPFVHWVVCPYLYGLWWTLSLLFIGLSVLLLFMNSDDPFLFYPLGCLSFFSLWPLMTPFSFVHCVICPFSLYDLWRLLSLFSIGLSVLLFMASDDPFLVVTLGCLSFSLWLLMTPFSFVHWVVCPSLYGLWWPLSILSIGLSVLLFMASDDPFLFCPLGCLPFFSLWPLMTPLSFVHWVVCPSSLYDIWLPLSLLSIVLSVLLFMASDNPSLFGPLGCLPFFSLWPLMTLHSLLSIGFSVLLFMASDEPFLFYPLGCLSFSLWLLMTPLSLVHWVVSPSSLYGLWWPLFLLSIGLYVPLFMASDEPIFFCPLGCLSFFSLWPLMTPLSFVHWVVCPSLYGLWWTLSLWSIGLSLLLFMASDDPFSFVHWVVCSSSLYELWWPLSLLSIGLSVLLLYMISDDPFLFCPLCYLSFFSLWPLMTTFSFLHWVVCPSLYGLWWPLSRCYIGLSVLLFMASDDPFLFCPLGCLFFFSLWPLMIPLYFVHWVVCPSLYGLWWPFSLLSIGLSALLLAMASDDPSLFCPLGCLSFFSLWHLMTPFSFVHCVVCPSLYGLW